MARACNGTSQGFSRSGYDLGGTPILSLAWWMKVNSYGSADNEAIAHGHTTNIRQFGMGLRGQSIGAGANTIGVFFTQSTPRYWFDSFPQPSTGVWHHYVWVMNRSTPSNVVYVDGVSQTMTAVLHESSTYGNFGNQTLYVMNRNSGAWVNGSIAELGVWGSNYQLTANDAAQLSQGASPAEVRPEQLVDYWPFFGSDSPEPGYMRGQADLTLIGSPTAERHPGVRTLLALRG